MAVYGPWMSDAIGSWLTSLNAMLVSDAYVHDPDLLFRDQITTEVAGAGYSSGGVVATGVAVAYDAATDTVRITCDDLHFGGIDVGMVGGIVFYRPVSGPTTDVLVVADGFDPVEVQSTVDFVYTVSPTGLVALTGGT